MVTYCKPLLSRLNINVCCQSCSKSIMVWWLEEWRLKLILYCKYLISTGSLRRCLFCPVWNKIRHQIVIFLDITSGYVRKWCGFSFLTLCDSSTRSFQNLCSGDWPIFLSLFLLGASLLLVSARLSHNMEWCKYILYPFKTKFIDHIFSSWNFWVSPSSDKVKAEVSSVPSSVPLEPGFSPSGGVGISRGMGVIPSLPGSLLLAQTFLHSSLGAMQGFVCTVMCTAPVFKCKSICSC